MIGDLGVKYLRSQMSATHLPFCLMTTDILEAKQIAFLSLLAAVLVLFPGHATASGPSRMARLQQAFATAEQTAGGARAPALLAAENLIRLAPRHWRAELLQARALVNCGRDEDAEAVYVRLAREGLTALVTAESAYNALAKRRPGVLGLIARSTPLTHRAPVRTEFEVKDLAAMPEGLALDPRTGRIFITSTYRRAVLVRTPPGSLSNFVPHGSNGLLQALGLRISRDRRALYVCSGADEGPMEGKSSKDVGRSALFRFDLKTGRWLATDWLPGLGPHLCNDLVEAPNGRWFITDSAAGKVMRFDPRTRKFKVLAANLAYPNGLALDTQTPSLFVADLTGLTKVDLVRGRATRMAEGRDVTAASIDGLYCHHGDLIGLQSGGSVSRVVRFQLDRSRTDIVAMKVLADGQKLRGATEGELLDGRLYLLINSGQGTLDDLHRPDIRRLSPAEVVSLPLDPN